MESSKNFEPETLKKKKKPAHCEIFSVGIRLHRVLLPSERHSAKDTVGSFYKSLKGPDEVCFETVKPKLRNLILSNTGSLVGTLLQELKKKLSARAQRHGGFSD